VIRLQIDGQPVSCESGENLVDAAARHGVYIPTLCHLPGKACLGTCRVCVVRVNGYLGAACAMTAAEGMEVEVDSDDLVDMRRSLVEALFSEGKHNCPSCQKSGSCELQAVGYEVGMLVSRFPYRHPVRPRETAGTHLWLERDRCIFCQRCVEHVRDEKTGRKIFSISGRGATAQIEMDLELEASMSEAKVNEAVALCPVGCILPRDDGYEVPIGERRYEVQTLREQVTEGKEP